MVDSHRQQTDSLTSMGQRSVESRHGLPVLAAGSNHDMSVGLHASHVWHLDITSSRVCLYVIDASRWYSSSPAPSCPARFLISPDLRVERATAHYYV